MNPFQQRTGFLSDTPALRFLIIANVVVYALEHFFLQILTYEGAPLGKLVAQYLAFYPIGSEGFGIWQVFTYQFLHANFTHILFNMIGLFMFGADVEREFGAKKFIVFYLLCGIGAAVTENLMSLLFSGFVPILIGASGSVFGVMVAFGMLHPNAPVMMFPLFIPIPARILVLIYAGIQVFNSVLGLENGVAHLAHLGGMATGFLLIKYRWIDRVTQLIPNEIVGNSRPTKKSFNAFNNSARDANFTSSDRPRRRIVLFHFEGEEVSQEDIDLIMDKINRGGYQSLSSTERSILAEYSRHTH